MYCFRLPLLLSLVPLLACNSGELVIASAPVTGEGPVLGSTGGSGQGGFGGSEPISGAGGSDSGGEAGNTSVGGGSGSAGASGGNTAGRAGALGTGGGPDVAGSSGTAGISGVAGFSGTSGASGSSGAAGNHEQAGSGGDTGSAGTAGLGGTGDAGRAGMSGTDGGSAGGEGGSPALDLDGDSWTQEDGDCCETQEQCPSPEIVNPGAFEIGGNDLDDNCDGVTDQGDALASCDVGLPSAVTNGLTAARALGLCAQASPENRRWGLLEARLLRADGSPLQDLRALSLRPSFGGLVPTPLEGERLLVLSTGIASDGSQKDPGPNGGAPLGSNVSGVHEPSSTVSLTQPGATDSVADWFAAAMPPLKPASSLPLVVGCPGQSSEHAADSVMLALRIRVPTNARSFSFRTRFLSAEYPEFVCTSYSDQYVALLGGPGAIGAPPDGNLLLYTDENGMPWPLSLPLALTPHFTVCEPEAEKPACWKSKVHPGACSEGAAMLTGTGFETPSGKPCPIGGATGWFVVRGAVIPGKEISLRLALWDVGDALFDSVALLDDFRWSTQEVPVGATPE